MTARVIEHITLTTGATRMSPRSEVENRVIAFLHRALAGDGSLPDGWHVQVTPVERGVWRFTLGRNGRVIVRCWLCAEKAASEALWEEAISEGLLDERAVVHRPRGVPWLACALTVEALHATPDELMTAGDAERCVAWALLEQGKQRGGGDDRHPDQSVAGAGNGGRARTCRRDRARRVDRQACGGCRRDRRRGHSQGR